MFEGFKIIEVLFKTENMTAFAIRTAVPSKVEAEDRIIVFKELVAHRIISAAVLPETMDEEKIGSRILWHLLFKEELKSIR